MPMRLDLEPYRGDDEAWIVESALDEATETLTAWPPATWTAQIRHRSRDEDPVTSFGIDDSDAANGFIIITLTAAQTRALDRDEYVWDLQRVLDVGGGTETIVAGQIRMAGDVSR